MCPVIGNNTAFVCVCDSKAFSLLIKNEGLNCKVSNFGVVLFLFGKNSIFASKKLINSLVNPLKL